jgi:uncharacterized surface protein with fasciclin (FAS1) repeats
MRFGLCVLFLTEGSTLVGCTPAPRPVSARQSANAGVNIVPAAILASEKEFPDTSQPANDSRPHLVQILSQSQQNHEKILMALRLSGLVPELQKVGPYTLLAPTDEAFDKLPPGTFERLMLPANLQQLRALLMYHLLNGRIPLKTMLDTNGQVRTLTGNPVIIKGIDNKVMINDVNVIRADDAASNGVIYWLDGVLLPSN